MSEVRPVPQALSQRFGADFQLEDGRWYYKQVLGYKGHNGDDYGCPSGTPVRATRDGVIEYEGQGSFHPWMREPAGICIIQKTSDGFRGYAHLSRTIVNKGQSVKKGEVIGYSGATGAATDAHLHYEKLPPVPNFQNGYAGRVDPKIQVSEGGEMPIKDTTKEFNRWKKLSLQVRGTELTRTEFRKAAVGKTWLEAIEILSDHKDAEQNVADAKLGREARANNWKSRIIKARDILLNR